MADCKRSLTWRTIKEKLHFLLCKQKYWYNYIILVRVLPDVGRSYSTHNSCWRIAVHTRTGRWLHGAVSQHPALACIDTLPEGQSRGSDVYTSDSRLLVAHAYFMVDISTANRLPSIFRPKIAFSVNGLDQLLATIIDPYGDHYGWGQYHMVLWARLWDECGRIHMCNRACGRTQ